MSDLRQQVQRLVVDMSVCAGHGMCYSTSPQLIDCDDQGYPVVLQELSSSDDVRAAEAAVIVCPERALTIEPR